MRAALVLAVLAALAAPGTAFAHASLTSGVPSYGERLAASPAQVRLHFDQGVKVFPRSILVLTVDGRVVSGPARSGTNPHDMVASLPRLPKGGYTIRWYALSSDSHTVSGVYTFGVGVAAPPIMQAYGSSGPTRTEDVVRWLYFLSLALLIGGMTFRLVVLPAAIPAAAERRSFIVMGLGVVFVLEIGIVAFLLRAEDALQLPLSKLLYGDLSPIAKGTRFGLAFLAMTLGYAMVAALVFLAWLLDRIRLLWPALVIALVFESGLSLSGHSAVDAGASWLSELADFVHLAAASIWVGGLVMLAAVVWPAAKELRRSAFLRFSRIATVCIAAILAAGVYLSVLRLPHVRDLWTQGYGQVLLVKLSLVAVALAWGAVHHFVARPALERGQDGILQRLPRSLVGESLVGISILLLAAVLVNSKPPPQPARAPVQAARVGR
ncbi:MAG TPA: CopD family protein [Gaiellaceae bacterium]|nr:CopD family protein [Gaiellaceae bacterium]